MAASRRLNGNQCGNNCMGREEGAMSIPENIEDVHWKKQKKKVLKLLGARPLVSPKRKFVVIEGQLTDEEENKPAEEHSEAGSPDETCPVPTRRGEDVL